jgi:hypothetical protein
LLDGRSAIPLAYRGQSRFQTTSTSAIADAVLRAVAGDMPAITNVSDADSPTVAEIGHAIMDVMGIYAELVGVPDTPAYPPKLGATPWSIPLPMVCTVAVPAASTYAQSVGPAVRWLVDAVPSDHWRERLPHLAASGSDHFDYQADQRALELPGARALNR